MVGEKMNTVILAMLGFYFIVSNVAFILLIMYRNKSKGHIASAPLNDDQAAEREEQAEKAKKIQKHFQSVDGL
jgi:hypothetical protein